MSTRPLLAADIHMGCPIYTAKGEKAGRLRFTVSDPEAPHPIRFLVIERGMMLHRDTMVPAEAIERSEKSGIHLSLTPAQLQELPEFTESRWFQRDGGGSHPGHGPTSGGGNREKRGRRGRRGHH